MSLNCFFNLHGVNFKNGFATSCPTQTDPLHILDGSAPSKFWNNERFRKHRQQLQNMNWPDGCHLCKEMEQDGLNSMRSDYYNRFDTTYYNPETGEMDFKGLKHIELRFNNSCNMACLHCDSVFSSGWETKLKGYKANNEVVENSIWQLTKGRHAQTNYDRMKISIDDTRLIIQDLCENFPNLEQFDCSGGEPLKQKQFFLALELLQNHPNAKNLHIFFYTNFNADFDVIELNELLSKFKKVTMHISIDAGKNIYHYFRDGNWNTLITNLERFRKINNNAKIVGVITYSIYQIMDIKDVFESILSLPLDDIKCAPVQTPEYINPSLIMNEYAQETINDINETRQMILDNEVYRRARIDQSRHIYGYLKSKDKFVIIENALKGLQDIEDYVTATKLDDRWYKSFFVYCRQSDNIWKQNFNDAFRKYKISNDTLIRTTE